MYGIEDKLLAILFSLMILLNAVVIRKVTGTFLVPAGVFALTWFVCTFIPLVALIEVPVNSLAILYILLAVFVYSLSSAFFNWSTAFRRNLTKSLTSAMFDSRFLEIAIYISAIAAMALSFTAMLINGYTFEQVVFDLVKTSGQYAAVRGTEGMEYGLVGALSVMFTYVGPVLGGLRIYAPRNKWFFVVTIFPSLLIMITQSSKLAFLVSIFFYLSGVIIAKIYANQLSLPKYSALLKIFFGISILSPLILISFVSRLGEFNFDNLSAITAPLLYSISSYTVGQIYAFSDFFSFAIGFPSASTFKNDFFSYGAFTFASIFEMLGLGKKFPPGMYDETGWYKDVFETNIFTFFRGLIYDFGVFGSLIFIFSFGIFSHAIMWRILNKSRAFLALSVFVSINIFILMSYLMSVFVARYVFLVACVVWLLLNINAHIYSVKKFLILNRKFSY